MPHAHDPEQPNKFKKLFKLTVYEGKAEINKFNRTTHHKPWTPEQTGLQECFKYPNVPPLQKRPGPLPFLHPRCGTPSGVTRTGPRIQPQSRSKSSAFWSRVPVGGVSASKKSSEASEHSRHPGKKCKNTALWRHPRRRSRNEQWRRIWRVTSHHTAGREKPPGQYLHACSHSSLATK